jgi:hypothetical protein
MTDIRYNVPISVVETGHIDCHIVEAGEVTEYLGQKVIELIRTVGTRHFEEQRPWTNYRHPYTDQRLPHGAIGQAYDPHKKSHIVRQTAQMRSELECNSVYAITTARDHQINAEYITSLAQVTRRWQRQGEVPVRTRSGYFVSIDQVWSRVPGRNLANVVLYSALSQIAIDPGDRIITDSLVGNRSNEWLARIGFNAVDEVGANKELRVGAVVMPQKRLALPDPRRRNGDYLLRRLAERRKWLAAGEII